ncbi:uncharacterized protein ARMOST_18410 [Armillaria ostoyae]|uniref:Uncharacterized protein n=1 Tax=Armillaria ostoyae TaxID=47428 RepID=A0A284S1R9_ARMOS|nr:uncharacterized protein ARMOST_18410 [Armillaria ostoyae]
MAVVSHPLLSARSKLYGRDTFIFSTSLPAKLLVGVNQRRIPISSATVQRWAYLLAPHSEPFHLRPVTVHQFGIMAYAIMPNGPPIPENSSKQLPPGNYGWYDSDSTARFLPQITTTPNPPSFAAMQKTWTIHPNPGIMCRFPPLRDDYHPIPQFFETASNAAFLHKDLIPFFHDNAFSVDVDDDYRVLIFRDIGPAEKLLPSHLRVSPNQGPEDWCLREHFRRRY